MQQSTTQVQEAQSIKNLIVSAIEDAKGDDIKIIKVSHLTQITDYMIITTGTSNRHIQTIAESAEKKAADLGHEKIGSEGVGKSEWVVIDFADVVLHIMSPTAREYYNIEGLWDITSDQKPS